MHQFPIMSRRVIIESDKAYNIKDSFSQAVLLDRTFYCSGQLGFDPKTGVLVPGGVKSEARQCLTNVGEVFKAAGSGFDKVLKVTVLLKDIGDFNAVNEVYKEFFRNKDLLPSRTAYQAADLPKGALVEIDAIAFLV